MEKIMNMLDYRGVQKTFCNDVVDPEFVPTENELQNIFNEIFAVDPVSGLPKGDIAYYLSPDGNPTVKQWLETNLLKPRSLRTGSSIEGVTDDLIAECVQGKDESLEDYASRLRGVYDSAAAEIEKAKVQNPKVVGNE